MEWFCFNGHPPDVEWWYQLQFVQPVQDSRWWEHLLHHITYVHVLLPSFTTWWIPFTVPPKRFFARPRFVQRGSHFAMRMVIVSFGILSKLKVPFFGPETANGLIWRGTLTKGLLEYDSSWWDKKKMRVIPSRERSHVQISAFDFLKFQALRYMFCSTGIGTKVSTTLFLLSQKSRLLKIARMAVRLGRKDYQLLWLSFCWISILSHSHLILKMSGMSAVVSISENTGAMLVVQKSLTTWDVWKKPTKLR